MEFRIYTLQDGRSRLFVRVRDYDGVTDQERIDMVILGSNEVSC